MYESFYGFKEKPFSMLPDPGFLFLSKKHRAALTLLEYGLLNHVGFCVISGEPGAGKTTILRALLERAGRDVTVGLITNTHQSFGGLLDWVLSAFDLHRPNLTQVEMHQIFVAFLIEEYAKNRTVLLIVDEAQNMNADTLEELRMLSNVNSEKDQLMQVMLAGQPALREVLRRPELMQFAQRIAVDYHLEPLSLEETCGYIQHRLVVAGAQKDVFTPAACERIHTYSGGTPRLINLLCETVLVYGFADQNELIDVDLVDEMVQQRMKHSVVPLVNRDIGEQDNDKESSKQMLRDFPWIRPEGGSRGLKPAAEAEPAVAGQNMAGQQEIEMAEQGREDRVQQNQGVSARGRQAEADAGQGAPVKTQPLKIEIETDSSTAVKKTTKTAPTASAETSSSFPEADRRRAGITTATQNSLIKYALITIVVLLLLIIVALAASGDKENSSEQANEQVLQLQQLQLQQQQQESARIQQLQAEAEALKQQRDAALEKIQQEQLAKQEAEKIAAEKAALLIKAAEQQRKRDEQKKITQAKASAEAAKQAEARARAEAEQAKLAATRLQEEQRLMQVRLQEEIRQKQELEARRMELELEQKQRLAEEQEKSRAQLVAEPDSKKKLSECSGPTARFKSVCR